MHATGLDPILLCKRSVLLVFFKLRSHVKQRQHWLVRCMGVYHARGESAWYQSNFLGSCNPATPVPPRSTHHQPALPTAAFHQIVQNSRTKYISQGGSKSTSHPKTMIFSMDKSRSTCNTQPSMLRLLTETAANKKLHKPDIDIIMETVSSQVHRHASRCLDLDL